MQEGEDSTVLVQCSKMIYQQVAIKIASQMHLVQIIVLICYNEQICLKIKTVVIFVWDKTIAQSLFKAVLICVCHW